MNLFDSILHFHGFGRLRGVLSGGINNSFRPALLAIWLLASEAAEIVLVYIIVVEHKMSSLNPHASKNGLKDKRFPQKKQRMINNSSAG